MIVSNFAARALTHLPKLQTHKRGLYTVDGVSALFVHIARHTVIGITFIVAPIPFALAQGTAQPAVSPAPAPAPAPAPTPEISAPSPTPAAVPPSTPPKATQLDSITVQGGRDAESSNGITRTIGQTELTKDGADNVLDVLKRQPGITVTNGQISLRGIGSAYVRVLVDGQRPPPGFSIEQLSPQMVERIEIIPGGGVEVSAQSMGGTINIILKRARSGQQGNFSASAEHGKYRTSIRGTATYGNGSGPLAWNFNSNWNIWEGFQESIAQTLVTDNSQAPAGTPINGRLAKSHIDSNGNSINFSPRLTYTPNSNTRLQAQIGVWKWSTNRDTQRDTQITLGPSPSLIAGNQLFDGGGHGYWWGGELTQGVSDHAKLELRVNGGRWNFNGTNINDFLSTTGNSVENDDNDNYGTWQGLKLIWRQNILTKHNLSFGIEHDGSDANLRRTNTLNGVNLLAPGEGVVLQRVRQFAGFARHEIEISPSLAMDTGVRFEQVQYTLVQAGIRETSPVQRIFAPSFQAQYKPNGSKTENYRFELSRKWRPLNAQDLRLSDVRSVDNRFDNPDRIGNVNLRAEKSWNADIAYTRRLGTDGSLGATLTAKRIDDVIKTVNRFESGRWVNRTENIGSGSIVGLELEAKGRLSDFVKGWSTTQVRGSIGQYTSRLNGLAGPGNRVANQLPTILNLGFDHRFAGTPYSLGGAFKYTVRGFEKITAQESIENNNERNLNFYGQWAITPKMNIRFALDDLLIARATSTVSYLGLGNTTTINNVTQTGPKLRINFDIRL